MQPNNALDRRDRRRVPSKWYSLPQNVPIDFGATQQQQP